MNYQILTEIGFHVKPLEYLPAFRDHKVPCCRPNYLGWQLEFSDEMCQKYLLQVTRETARQPDVVG